ncbi:MAG: nitrophenyl compound nitroreductase subunit ArsF family protein [Candidatus Zixiibacteriota bacterium]
MNIKSMITVLLLVFVAVSITVLVMRNTSTPTATVEPLSTVSQAGDRVVAYYFHRTQRCPTCLRIEELAHEVVHQQFVPETSSGKLELRIINIENAGNEHFETDFDLVSQSIVLVNFKDGKQTTWKNLDQIWELIGDEPSFTTYVAEEIRSAMSGS